MTYETITVTRSETGVGTITLDRPKALNALNSQLMTEVVAAATELDADQAIGCIVVTGAGRAFAAGADIKEMSALGYSEVVSAGLFGDWDQLTDLRTPILASVNGFALGGGCELAMLCDLAIAGESAKFGQPEITLGVIPGIGGSQRLTRAVGKAVAMDLCLTGRMLTSAEALSFGLVSRVVPDEELAEVTRSMAEKIASFSRPSVWAAKDVVNVAFETTLAQGVHYERTAFYALFATEDQTEGMTAFLEKRAPDFQHR